MDSRSPFKPGTSFAGMTTTEGDCPKKFGVRSLGAIAGVVSSAGVSASALSPVMFGWLIDHGVNIDLLILGGVILTAVVSILAFLAPPTSARDAGSTT